MGGKYGTVVYLFPYFLLNISAENYKNTTTLVRVTANVRRFWDTVYSCQIHRLRQLQQHINHLDSIFNVVRINWTVTTRKVYVSIGVTKFVLEFLNY